MLPSGHFCSRNHDFSSQCPPHKLTREIKHILCNIVSTSEFGNNSFNHENKIFRQYFSTTPTLRNTSLTSFTVPSVIKITWGKKKKKQDPEKTLTGRLHGYLVGHRLGQPGEIRRLEAVAAHALEVARQVVDAQAQLALERRGLVELVEAPEAALALEHRRGRVRPLDRERVVDLARGRRRHVCKITPREGQLGSISVY